MKQSHPGRWIYGGVLDTITWEAGTMDVHLWDRREVTVEDGDRVLILRTPVAAQLIQIEEGAWPAT